MKALQLVEVGKPMEINEVPTPVIRTDDRRDDNQVIVRVKACGLCGTDLHHVKGTAKVSRLPMILGHEISGVVEEVGETVPAGRLFAPTVQQGDRVNVNNVIFCGECVPCRRGKYNFCENQLMFGRQVDGGLAEFVKVPARNLIRLPDEIDFSVGAILGCAAVTAFHAVRLGDLAASDAVVVWGVGGVGLSLILLAREVSGAYPIIAVGRRTKPLKLAKEIGADFSINVREEDPVERILDLTEGVGADAVYDTAGITETDEKGTVITLKALGPGGRLIVVATYGDTINLEPHDELGVFEKSFTGSCGNVPRDLHDLVKLVAGRNLNFRRLIAKEIVLEQVNDVLLDWLEHGGMTRAVVTF